MDTRVPVAMKRWWWILLGIAIVIGACRLRFDPDILNLLPTDEPAVQGLKLYQEHFTNARELIVAVRSPDAEIAEQFAGALAEKLRTATNLVESVTWQPPWLEHPDQLSEILACLWLSQPPADFAQLTNRLAPDHVDAVLADAREVLTTSLSPTELGRRAFDPFNLLSLPALTNVPDLSMDQGQKMFVSPDGKFRLLFVEARPELNNYRQCTDWLNEIRSLTAAVKTANRDFSPISTEFTGRPVFVAEISAQMQTDLTGSSIGTAVIIGILFWLAHRRWKPMLWLLALLLVILASTLALGGLILGTINLVSLGFAAVLLGLAVDYAVVHYQEALAHPHLSVPEIRRAIAPSILWAATTTICAFLVLNLGGLPGLAQLGSLVAIGVALAALVMVMIYLPPLFPDRRHSSVPMPNWWNYFVPPKEPSAEAIVPANPLYLRAASAATVVVLLGAIALICIRPPVLDHSADPLKPRHSEAQSTLEQITTEMGIPQNALWLIISGKTEQEIWERLLSSEHVLETAREQQWVTNWLLPAQLWPCPECQASNRVTAAWFEKQSDRLHAAAQSAGFNTNALQLSDQIFGFWSRAASTTNTVWPTNDVSTWLLKRFVTKSDDRWFVLGLVYPASGGLSQNTLSNLTTRLDRNHTYLSGWSLLGTTTLKRVQDRMWLVVAPMLLLVLLSLWLAFRRPAEIFLGFAVLCLSGGCLLTVMSMAGWSWNLLSLMAIPLLLGTGVDYSIFMQLALRRHNGNIPQVWNSIGRALLLCGGTAITGFGSLAWSGSAGMASLGKICATGLAANMLISILLLPAWWRMLHPAARGLPQPPAPSRFYRAWLWKTGYAFVQVVPVFLLRTLCHTAAEIYYRLNRERRGIVVQNLLPVVGHNRAVAERKAHELFHSFASKLVDLWRFEIGVAPKKFLTSDTDFQILEQALARKCGVLLVTPHLGNWELGGVLLARLGMKIVVLTQEEPGVGLTEMRRASRARWGIETVVVGGNGFDFVEVIRRLRDGESVALLIDRPPAAKAAEVTLFGQPFHASLAAAELARAAGCAIIGVTIVADKGRHVAKLLSEFTYNRADLATRESRHKLTQQIMTAFEPEIRSHSEQWFHFVPLWKKPDAS